jgi:hypothetical protein
VSSLVDPAEYAARTGQTLGVGQEVLLEEASDLVRENSPGIEARFGVDISEVRVKGIVCDVVRRYLANPTLASQQGDGPFLTSWAARSARGMFLTDDEISTLNPTTVAGRARGVGSIRVGIPVRPRRGCW